MELRISELAKQYPASGIRKMFDLAAGYDDVIALTLGEPNFETPAYIKEAAKKALDENYTHYAPNAGLPVLRQAVADRYQSYWDGYKADNIVVTVGALEGLTLCLLALLNRDDEILVPDPCFANYYGQAMIAGRQGGAGARPRGERLQHDRCRRGEVHHPQDEGHHSELPLQPHRRGDEQGGRAGYR